MSPKKQYQKRLPAILPPTPRRAPDVEARSSEHGGSTSEEPQLDEPTYDRPAPVPGAPASVTPASVTRAPMTPPPVRPAPPAPATSTPPESAPRPALRHAARLGAIVLLLGGLAVAPVALTRMLRSPAEPTSSSPARPPADSATAPADENYVVSRIRSDGVVVVRQRIRSDTPLSAMTVRLPDISSPRGVSAGDVRVVADGVTTVAAASIGPAGATYRFDDATEVRLRYRLSGAVEVSDPTTGRALVRATSLRVGYRPQPTQATQVVLAPDVLSLACAADGSEVLEPCGVRVGDQWRAELEGPRTTDRVVAVVDLGS